MVWNLKILGVGVYGFRGWSLGAQGLEFKGLGVGY